MTEQKLGKSEAAVWENIRISGQNMITVSLSNNPFENEVRYGLIMPDGKLRYVYGSGMCSHAFEVGSAGTYKIYVENVSSSSMQDQREVNYQKLLSDMTEKYAVVEDIRNSVDEIQKKMEQISIEQKE